MEQGEEMDFKTLKSKFQNDETFKIRTKPAIPEKHHTVTSPTTKVSNPLIASMNSAMENRMRFAPRVIFKEKSPIKRQLSQPETLQVNTKHPHVQPELLDKNQKKEGDLIKQALKDRKLPLVLPASPVTPAVEKTPRPLSAPASGSPFKLSSPKKTSFNFKMPLQSEKEKRDTSENAVLASTAPLDGLVSSSPTPSVKPIVSKPVPPEAHVMPALAATVPLSTATTLSAPESPPSSIPPPAGFESETPVLKDSRLPPLLPMSPITPVLEKTPKPQPTPSSSVLSPPVKVSTPKKTTFNFKSPLQSEKEKVNTSESDVPVSPAIDDLVCSSPTPSMATIVSKNVSPKACALPVLVQPVTPSSIPAPRNPASDIPSPAVPESVSPILTASEPDNFSKTGPKLEISNPQIPITLNSIVPIPAPAVFSPALTEESPEMLSDILDMDIPPPIIPEDLPDAVVPDPHMPSSVSPKPVMVSTSPVLSRTASPALATNASIIAEPSVTLLPPTVAPDAKVALVTNPSPLLLTASSFVDPVLENGVVESHNVRDDQIQTSLEVNSSSSPKSISAQSALARAEEMSPPSKHNACDQRLLSLLEKSKQKYTANSQSPTPTTPEITLMETAQPVNALPESLPTETGHHETPPPEKASPVLEALALPRISLVDLKDHAWETTTLEPDPQPSESTLSYGLDPSQASPVPKLHLVEHSIAEVKAEPPPPPPRRHVPPVPNLDLTPEKLTQILSTDVQTSTPAAETVEDNGIIIPAPADFISGDSAPDDSKFEESPETEVPQEEVPEILQGTPAPLVHNKVFWDMSAPEHQSSEMCVPNVEATDLRVPRTETDGLLNLKSDSPGHETIPSPLGTQQLNYNSGNHIVEDPAVDARQAKIKKQRKGSPINPYAEAPIGVEETHKKNTFSRKNSGPDDKELKKKDKQREKDKEKDKVNEKPEQKDKEREKKEQKDKEREKKEQKEREKKEEKEKEREKKEQKEKEKKEIEIKKKFKVTGEEEVIYHAKVTETCKGRKDDLAVRAGDVVNIIRTTGCPKGKWLAKDSTNKYGYIAVESVELDMQKMLGMGKKAKARSHANINGLAYTEPTSTGSRSPNHYNMTQESFTDDSEEWADDDDTAFIVPDTTDLQQNQRAVSPERVSSGPYPAQEAHTDASGNVQARQEALQKLATFFAQPKSPALDNSTITEESGPEEPVSSSKQDADLHILPPPDLYADHQEAAHN